MSQSKFVVAFVVATIMSLSFSVKAEELLDTASSAAMEDLAEVMEASPGAKRALREAKELQTAAKKAVDTATAADKAKEVLLKKAKEDFEYIVGVEDGAYDTSGSNAPLPSLNAKSQADYDAAAVALRNAQQISAQHIKDNALSEAVTKAHVHLMAVRKKVGEIRARVKAQNAGRFNEPSNETEDERVISILTAQYEAAKAAKAKTAETLAAKVQEKKDADDAVKAAVNALKELKLERERIRATEELRNGFIKLRTEVKAVQTSVDLGNADVVASVDTVATKVGTTNTLVGDISRKVDRTNQLLVEMNGQMVKLETAIKESTEALTAKIDAKSAELLVEIGKVPVETKAQGDRIAGLLEKYTKMLEEATQNKSDKGEILAKLGELKATLERHVTADSRRLVWWNRCTQTWIAFDPIS